MWQGTDKQKVKQSKSEDIKKQTLGRAKRGLDFNSREKRKHQHHQKFNNRLRR